MNEILDEKLNKKLTQGIKEIREIKMSAQEKSQVLKNILGSSFHPKTGIRSPYIYALVPALALAFCVVLVFASNGSLPGGVLYPLKVNVVEPFHSALLVSPVERADYQSSLATERLQEAETLDNQGTLDAPKEDRLNTLLSDHTKAFDRAVVEINQKNPKDPKISEDIQNNFQADLNAHAKVLDILNTQKQHKDSAKGDNGSGEKHKDSK